MEILELLQNKQISQITKILDETNNVDIATLLNDLDIQDAIKVFRLLKTALLQPLFQIISNKEII